MPAVRNGVLGRNPIPALICSTGTIKIPYSFKNYFAQNSIFYREYKFYLAFENSNCKDYITEKFFVNGLK